MFVAGHANNTYFLPNGHFRVDSDPAKTSYLQPNAFEVARFTRCSEASALGETMMEDPLRHPFLLSTQMYYALEDRLLIVMELADGSLRDRLRECRRNGLPTLPVSELMGYLQESAEGLDFLHERRVVHRDVKPENILLMQRHAKLGDFGMARLIEDNRGGGTGDASGTPMYMAPEVWRGEPVPASDQYALALSYVGCSRLLCGIAGVLATALLTGQWHGSGVALGSGSGPLLWSENLLAMSARDLILGAGVGMLLGLLLPRVGQRRRHD